MELLHNKKYTYDEFIKITKTEDRVEFIGGEIYYMSPAPNTEHQRISSKIERKLGNYFDNTQCEVYHAPYDILFQEEEASEKQVVQPDISVICDKSKFTETNYQGVPSIVIEILSKSTASRDYIVKMNLYLKFKVPEYWIVSPFSKTIQIFTYDEEIKAYGEPLTYAKDDTLISSSFNDLSINLAEIF